VWATWTTAEKQDHVPPGAWQDPDTSTIWVQPATDFVKFIATIEPGSILDLEADVPQLSGTRTQDVPASYWGSFTPAGHTIAQAGAPKKWDISRRTKARYINPTPTSIQTAQYRFGGLFEEWVAVAKSGSFPAADFELYQYPPDPLEGNDDGRATDEDNNPYSASDIIDPGTSGLEPHPQAFTLSLGELASYDAPQVPWIDKLAGNDGETVTVLHSFEEFVRLQIGNRSDSDYRSWYLISDPLPWHHTAMFKRNAESFSDDGSGVTIP
jgi:hypothetical protein